MDGASAAPTHNPEDDPFGCRHRAACIGRSGISACPVLSGWCWSVFRQTSERHSTAGGSAGGAAIPEPQPQGNARGIAFGSFPDGGAGGIPIGPHPGGIGGIAAEESQGGAGGSGESVPPPRRWPPGDASSSSTSSARVPHAEGPRASQREVGSGMNGGVPVSHRSAQAPQGIHNLGEALITICALTPFPPAQGMTAYAVWEAQIKELIVYVLRRTDTVHSHSCSIAQGLGATTVHQGGTAAVSAHHGEAKQASAGHARAQAVAHQPATAAPATAARDLAQLILVSSSSSRHHHEEAGADLARTSYSFDGGCLDFTDALHRVTWPRKFRPGITFKYDGTIDPCEFL
jgi:hypothetical protein